MSIPEISVIIAVYNAENHLPQCLDSIFAQSLKKIEIICIDDGSTDGSPEILQEYRKKDSRIQIITQKNAGAGAARNAGLRLAKGKYLSILDADDFFDKDMLLLAWKHIVAHQADMVIFDAFDYDNELGTYSTQSGYLDQKYLPDKDAFSPEDISDYIFNITMGCVWNKLYSREFINQFDIRFQEIRRIDDLYFEIIASAQARKICVLKERLVYYRKNNAYSQQSHKDCTYSAIYDALLGTKNELIKRGRYQAFRRSFKKYALINLVSDMEGMRTFEAFQFLFEKLKEELSERFGYLDLEEQDFYEAGLYDRYKSIMKYSLSQYLFEKLHSETDSGVQSTGLYPFPFHFVKKNKRIIIYGAGDVGCSYFYTLMRSCYCKSICWVDRDYENIGLPVQNPKEILEQEYDYILLATRLEHIAISMKDDLLEMGIDLSKIVYGAVENRGELKQ